MRRQDRLRLLLLTFLLASAAGLACHRPPRSASAPTAGAAAGGFQALYQVRVEEPEGSRSLRLTVAVSEGSRFRLEVLGPVGGARLALVFDGTSLRAALPAERLCGEWQDTAAALRDLTGIALPAPQWLALLLGRLGDAELEASALRADEIREGRVVRAHLADEPHGGASGLRTLRYDDFRPAPGGDLAAEVRMHDGARQVSLSLRRLEPLAPSAAALTLPCPPGFRAAGASEFAAAGVSFLGGER